MPRAAEVRSARNRHLVEQLFWDIIVRLWDLGWELLSQLDVEHQNLAARSNWRMDAGLKLRFVMHLLDDPDVQ